MNKLDEIEITGNYIVELKGKRGSTRQRLILRSSATGDEALKRAMCGEVLALIPMRGLDEAFDCLRGIRDFHMEWPAQLETARFLGVGTGQIVGERLRPELTLGE